MSKNAKRKMMSGRLPRLALDKLWLVMFLLLAGSMTGYAQSECFTYEDEGKTITGLTETGQAATSLTIPQEVTTVRSRALYDASNNVSALVIEAGGNPEFESGLFYNGETTRTNPLVDIQILGSSMTVANIKALFTSLGAQGALSTVYVEGYSDAWSDIEETGVLTSDVRVALPAALVTDQKFGNALVYGRFEITKEIITFCGSATFRDTDNGSNMLFYRADAIADDGRLHIQRVDYVVAGEGVLIHRAENSEGSCDLERYSGSASYTSNLLKGVTEPTTIESTDGDYTNYILKDGAFHPTSGGIVKANKAYLQIPKAALAREGALTISFDEETSLTPIPSPKGEGSNYYDLQGRKVYGKPTAKGLYINNGKKYVIR